MKIIVNGKEAVLRSDISFEYNSENPLFNEAEGYSLDITFPLKDSPQNILIFGPLHIKGVDIPDEPYECEIIAGSFHKAGILTIIGVDERDVQCQFLEGKSAQNFRNELPDVYISDLDYSAYDGTGGASSVSAVNGSGWTTITVYDKKNNAWLDSRHIYLWKLIDLVFDIIGWSVDKTVLSSIPMFQYLVVTNVREHLSGQYRRLGYSLPVWTIRKFIQNICYFFGCTYDLDDNAKSVKFVALSNWESQFGADYYISTIDSFTVDDASEEDGKWRGSRVFKLPDVCNPDGRNICAWALRSSSITTMAIRLDDFIENALYGLNGPTYSGDTATHSKGNDQTLIHAIYRNNVLLGHAIVTGSEDKYDEGVESGPPTWVWQTFDMINQYGGSIDGEELKIAPCDLQSVVINHTVRRAPIMDIPEDLEYKFGDDGPVREVIASGQKKVEESYYKNLWLVIKKGNAAGNTTSGRDLNTRKWEPVGTYRKLASDSAATLCHKDFDEHDYTLSPSAADIATLNTLEKVDETKLYRYKFLSSTLPDVKRTFVIKGKRYVCQKLTVHFTDKGMSELIEGEFYRIID